MAAEYEVNIKINSDKVVTDLNKVDNKIKNLGKSATSQEKGLQSIVDKRARLMNRINEMEGKGLNVAKLRKQMGKATTEQGRKDLANAQKEFRILERNLRLEQSKLRILKAQRQGFPASPVRGVRSMMGSPAQISASGRQAVSPIGGRIDIAGSPAQMQAIRKLELAEIRADKNVHFAELKLIQKRQKVQMDNIDKELAKDMRALETFDKKLAASDDARAKRIAGAQIPGLGRGQTFGPASAPMQGPRQMMASPVGGAASIPGSPAALSIGRRNKRLEQVGLGAGFPLLFGGGAGSVLGGAAGGLTGSFGAQIAFSAIGQQIDQMVTSVMNAGRAFGSLSETLELIRERSLFTSKDSEELARQLEELGDIEGLAELATIELASKIGTEGIEAFQDLEAEIDEFDRLAGNLALSLQAFLAGPLAGFLNIINATLGKQVTRGTVDRLAASLTDPAGREKFLAEATKEIGTQIDVTGFGFGGASGLPRSQTGLKPASLDLLSDLQRRVAGGKEFGPSTLLSRRVKITRRDRDSFEADPSIKKAAREEEQLQKRLDKLEAERQKVLDISRFRDKIAAANAAEDQQLVIRLNGEQKIVEIEAKRNKDLAGITKQREKDAINIGAATKKLAAQRDTERELNELQRKRQEKFQDTIEGLDHQLALARATTEEERERLRIEENIRRLREDDKLSDPQLAAVKLRMEALAEENNLINTFIRETQEQIEKLNDPMFQTIALANTLGNAFSESFKGIVSGSMTAQQALANLFQRTADHFLDMAAQMIAAQIRMQAVKLFMSFSPSLFGGGAPASKRGSLSHFKTDLGPGPRFADPKRFAPPTLMAAKALGGPVSRNQSYLVGERGPEMFVPGAQGNIVPNNAMGGGGCCSVIDCRSVCSFNSCIPRNRMFVS